MPAEDMTSRATLKRSLGFWEVLLFSIVYMAPIAAFTMFGFVNFLSGGAVVPAFVLGAVALAFTAVSYGTMANVAPSAGSSFAFAKLAFGHLVGFLTGWAILLDYLLLSSLTALYGAIFLNLAVPEISMQIWLAGFLALTILVNAMGIRWSLTVDLATAGLQFIFIAVFAVLAIALVARGELPPAALWPSSADAGGVLAGASVAVITYLGFDAAVTLTEEVSGDQPGRIAGRAGVAAIFVMMIVFVGVNWLLATLGSGLEFPDPSQSSFVVIGARMPSLVWPVAVIAALSLGIGATISIHASVSRIIFGMAREGYLPSPLAKIGGRNQTPLMATLSAGAIIVIVAFLALPNVELLSGLVSFGALIAFLAVNLSVIGYFGIRLRSKQLLRNWILPGLGAAVVAYVLSGVRLATLEVGAMWIAIGLVVFALMRWWRFRPVRA